MTSEKQTVNRSEDFFISYNEADRLWAEWIAWCLEQAGYSVVIAVWDFPPGANFIYEMDSALKRAKRVISVLSPDYLGSAYAFSEWAEVFRRDPQGKARLLLPVRVRFCEVIGVLGPVIFCDLIECDEPTARKQLLAAVRGTQPHPATVPFPGTFPLSTKPPPFPKSSPFLAILKECITFYRLWAKRWLQLPIWLANFLCVIFILLVLNFLPQNIPLISFLKQHSVGTLVLGATLMLVTFTSLIALYFPQRKESEKASGPNLRRHNQYIVIISSTSIINFLLCTTLLMAVFFRLTWCPANLCPASQILTNAHRVHDADLEMYFLALQSTSFVIPYDPVNYPQNKLPENIGAVRIDKQAPSSLYRVVIGVHSLEKGVYSILIERVTLVVEQVIPMPRPLNVWLKGSPIDYHANPYQALYDRETAGGKLSAVYTPVPYANVQLAPGEADQIDIQVTSHTLVDFRFHIQLTYRLSQKSILRTLTLPDTFEVVFSNNSNWNEYYLQKGHFVLNSELSQAVDSSSHRI